MAYPKELRNKLGISLEAFATLINCNYGQLSMAESGKRQLPVASLSILALLENALATAAPSGSITTLGEEEIAFFKKEQGLRQLQLEQLSHKAATVATKWEKAEALFNLASLLAPDQLPDTGNSQLQMAILKRKAAQKQSLYKQQWHQLQFEIESLKAVIALAKKALKACAR